MTRRINAKDGAQAIAMLDKQAGTFNRGQNAGTAVCTVCGTRRQKANMERTDPQDAICNDCFDQAGRENAHADGHHEDTPDPLCPDCASGVVNADGTPTQATIDMLRPKATKVQATKAIGNARTRKALAEGDVTTMVASDVAKARVQDREAAIKAKQTLERRAANGAAKAKATGTGRATSALRDDKLAFRLVKATPAKATPAKAKIEPVKDALGRVNQTQKVKAVLLRDPFMRPMDVAKETGVPASFVWDIRANMRRQNLIPTPEAGSPEFALLYPVKVVAPKAKATPKKKVVAKAAGPRKLTARGHLTSSAAARKAAAK